MYHGPQLLLLAPLRVPWLHSHPPSTSFGRASSQPGLNLVEGDSSPKRAESYDIVQVTTARAMWMTATWLSWKPR